MCGRGALEQGIRQEALDLYEDQRKRLAHDGVPAEWADVAAAVGAEDVAMEGPRARYNIAPTDWIPTLSGMRDPVLTDTRWGVDRGAKRSPAFNARVESVLEGSWWAPLVEEGRAVHVLSGFYEWRGGNRNDPVYVTRTDGQPLLMAAVVDERPSRIGSATITREAPEWFASVHDRMPVLLDRDDAHAWLGKELGPDQVTAKHLGQDALELRPVQTDVNKVGNNGPHLVMKRPTLF